VLDGTAVGEAPEDGDTPLIIGARGNNPSQSPFKGMIDEVRLWRDSRSDADLLANINTCLNGDEDKLVGYWRFNEGSGFVAHDSTANGNNGLLINGPEWVSSPIQCILPSPLPRSSVVAAHTDGNNELRVQFSGDPATHSCLITVHGTVPNTMPMVEVSRDLLHWVPLICVTNNTTGCFRVVDPVNPKAPHRFFRVRAGH